MENQQETIKTTLKQLSNEELAIIKLIYQDPNATTDSVAYQSHVSINEINALIAKFKNKYAENGGTDYTEKQLLKPIADHIKEKKKNGS